MIAKLFLCSTFFRGPFRNIRYAASLYKEISLCKTCFFGINIYMRVGVRACVYSLCLFHDSLSWHRVPICARIAPFTYSFFVLYHFTPPQSLPDVCVSLFQIPMSSNFSRLFITLAKKNTNILAGKLSKIDIYFLNFSHFWRLDMVTENLRCLNE